jgi:Tol biopolymer transport system component
VIDLVRGTESRFTFSDGQETEPDWSPDGSHICWASSRGSAFQIFQKASSGAGGDELLANSDTEITIDGWSPDGRSILFDRSAPQTKKDLWVLPLDGERQPVQYLSGPFNETQGRFSPDGRWVVYTSDESGKPEIYLQSYPASAAKVQVSVSGGTDPKWRADGKELFYVSADNKLVSVDVRVNGGAVGVPKPLFALGELSSDYSPSADGQRFLFATQGQQGSALQYDLITNWTAGPQK